MNVFRVFFILLVFTFQCKAAYVDKLPTSKSAFDNPFRREYLDSRFHFKVSQGIGIRNLTSDLLVNYQFRQIFSFGIGGGFHRNKVSFFSTSDKHKLKLWSCPVYLSATIYLRGTTKDAFYIYGRYGRSFGISTKSNNPDNEFSALMAEGGIGFEVIMDHKNRSLFAEIGQYYTKSKGTYLSTYDSVIEYNFTDIFTILMRLGIKI